MSNTNYDVIVVGGGLHGCSAALHLAMQRARVLVIDKDFSGQHASGVNAGGVRRLGRDTRELALADASLKLWNSISELVDDDCGFSVNGHMKVAETEFELEALKKRVAELKTMGYHHEVIVDRSELRQIVPEVARHCVGGLFVAGDGAAMPYQTTQAFRQKAERLGVVFKEGVQVVGIAKNKKTWRVTTNDSNEASAPTIVNCAGAWAGEICGLLGEFAPVEQVAPMLMITAAMDHFVSPVVSAAGRTLSFKQFENGTVLIGGGLTGYVDKARNRAELNFSKLAINARTALDLFPIMEQSKIVRSWAGIEARMPDDIPVMGASSTNEGVFHSFGYSLHGFQLGPISGQIIAEAVCKGNTSVDISPFSINRFVDQAR
ncbi:MAG: FAD-binding oxidoreductase [Devosiaceae bacterium]|nr:FAD-binding oxidoreductase [Devosiaceae bacterium]